MRMVAAHPFAAAYNDRFVEVGGLRLHHTEWNPQGDRHAVLVHGLNVQAHTWDPVAAELAGDGYHAFAFSPSGHIGWGVGEGGRIGCIRINSTTPQLHNAQ